MNEDEDNFWYHSPDVHGSIHDLSGKPTRKIKIGFIDFEKEKVKARADKRKPVRKQRFKGD